MTLPRNVWGLWLATFVVALAAGCAQPPAHDGAVLPAPEHGVTEFTLDNGMKVLVQQDRRAPIVVAQIWYRVGGGDEYGGVTGISHLLEHMMFKGTEKYPRTEFTRTIKRYGGRDNAFTGSDYTAYYQHFEKARLPVSFELESDRMVNLILREEDLEKEREVVKEERRWRVDDRPEALVGEQLYATAFNNAPYRNPIVGWMKDVEQLSLADLRDWYARWYAPNNAVYVVAGDVDPVRVRELAQRYFGPIAARAMPARKSRNEPPQRGERRVAVAARAVQPYLAMGYRVPRVGRTPVEWHPYALSVLSAVLGGGGTSRFAKRLVRGEAIAQHAGTGYNPYTRYDDLFTVSAAPVKGVAMDALEQALVREIAALRDEPVHDDELVAVKARLVAHEVYRRDSLSHQAYLLGSLETIGIGWRELFRYRERIEAVTPRQVREVAERYLSPERRTVAVLKPQGVDGP